MGVSLVFLELFVFITCSIYIEQVLPCFFLAVINSAFLLKHLQVYPLYVLLDSFDLFESQCLISLVVVAVLVECVYVLDLLHLEPVVECLHSLQLLVRALYLVLDVRQVARTLKLVLAHLKLHSLHRKHLKLFVIHTELVVKTPEVL